MSELDRKDQQKKKQAEQDKKRRDNANDDIESGDATNLIAWDADVEHFFEVLERNLHDLRTSMSHSEFRTVSTLYRDLSPNEKRSVANRLQRRGLGALVRALHSGDFRLYLDSWAEEARLAREAEDAPKPGEANQEP
jgi:hypothetical protein